MVALVNPVRLSGWIVSALVPGVPVIDCVHFWLSLGWRRAAAAFSAASEHLYLAAVFLLSLAVAKLLARVPAARRLQ